MVIRVLLFVYSFKKYPLHHFDPLNLSSLSLYLFNPKPPIFSTHLVQVPAGRLWRRQLVRIQLQLPHNVLDQLDEILVLVLQQQILGDLETKSIKILF